MSTPWHDQLQQNGAQLAADGHIVFRLAAQDTALAANGTVVVPLTHLRAIDVSGEDACAFLHNLTSNSIKALSPGKVQHNSLNGPKGRMLASFIIWSTASSAYTLLLSADLQASLLKKLGMYVLRSKVKLSAPDEERVLLGIAGSQAAAILSANGLAPQDGTLQAAQHGAINVIHLDNARYILDLPVAEAVQLWQSLTNAGATAAGSAAWQWLDIQAGQPLVTAKTQDEFVAQMLNFELLGGVDFKKGCFPGQEIIARTQHLGTVKKRMYRAHAEDSSDVLAGTDVYAPEFGEQSCGKVVSAIAAPNGGLDMLVVLQRSAHEAGEVHLASPSGPHLSFTPLPYTID